MKFKYIVEITERAENDILEIYKYVSINDSFEKADKLFDAIFKKCISLEQFAKRGHYVLEILNVSRHKFLEIHYKPYRIIYEIKKKKVFIRHVIDGRRDIQSILRENLLRK